MKADMVRMYKGDLDGGFNPLPGLLFLLYRKFLLNHELCKQIALQKQGTENRRLRLEDIKTFFSKIVIVDIIKFM